MWLSTFRACALFSLALAPGLLAAPKASPAVENRSVPPAKGHSQPLVDPSNYGKDVYDISHLKPGSKSDLYYTPNGDDSKFLFFEIAVINLRLICIRSSL
jgi:hypothetical protein